MSPQVTHTIAAVLLEIGYLAVGVVLCYFGKDLLEKGIKGTFRGDGTVATTKFRVVTSSPGLVFMLAGLVIIGIAIRTKAEFFEGVPAIQPASADASAPGPSLQELAGKVVVSRYIQPTPEQRFALTQMEAAQNHVARKEETSALLALTNAIIVNPALLKSALDDPGMAGLTTNAALQAIVRDRFKLPLFADAKAQTDAHPVVAQLGMFASDRRDLDRDSEALRDFPPAPDREPIEATAARLRTSLSRNPRALYALLRKPDFQWVFAAEPLVEELRAGMARLESPATKR